VINVDKIVLRKAHGNDVGIYFEWVNDSEVRKQSFNSEAVLWQAHQEWYKNKLLDENCFMFVMESDNQPVGQIRFDVVDGVANIDYSLDKKARGKHLGERLISDGIDMVLANRCVVFQASIKKQNLASIKTIKKLGFDEVESNNPEKSIFQKKVL